ncbi:hypothetical protein Taro_015584 [Colocasia esculenta]|uniref:Uncharacterized protein n=1 Tax=Colocasia esculenta TaxID=4460 RepID=A0A843UML5_COLES|nr:hypothetical protein [Colocasia esculenta]
MSSLESAGAAASFLICKSLDAFQAPHGCKGGCKLDAAWLRMTEALHTCSPSSSHVASMLGTVGGICHVGMALGKG